MPKSKRLGILTVGMGAVSTTLFAGVEAVRRGLTPGVGSLTQMGHLPLVPAPGAASQSIQALLDLAKLEDLVFGGWDLIEKNAYQAAVGAGVLTRSDLAKHRKFLKGIRSFPGVADPKFTTRIEAVHEKGIIGKLAQVNAIRADIRTFLQENQCDRLVVISCMSVEVFQPPQAVHDSLAKFEHGLAHDDPNITPSQLYAYAVLSEGVPFINGTPNTVVEATAIKQLARREGLPLAGSDFKSGQTYIKTVIAGALRARLLGLSGWFSTNILGNRDGLVLEDPAAFEAKRVSKTSVLDDICDDDTYPELYDGIEHQVKIHHYGPRGDDKESWDSIDLFGWLGYGMQMKINFQCKDSILAAPLALDLVLLTDLAARQGESGVLEWLGFFFKSPGMKGKGKPSNNPAVQLPALELALRRLGRRKCK